MKTLLSTLMMLFALSNAFSPFTNLGSTSALRFRGDSLTCTRRPEGRHRRSSIIKAALSDVTMPALSSTMKEGCGI